MKSLENFSQRNQEVTHTFYSEKTSNKIKHLDGIVNVVVQNGAEGAAELTTLYTAYKGADPIVVQSAYSSSTVVEQNLQNQTRGRRPQSGRTRAERCAEPRTTVRHSDLQ